MEVGLVVGFSFCALVLLLILRYTSVHWVLKTGLTLLSLGAVFAFYTGLIDCLGWPVHYKPKCVMMIEWVDVREPSDKSPGAIFVWYVDVDESIQSKRLGKPRAIQMPYSKEDHKKLRQAMFKIVDGETVYMSLDDPSNDESNPVPLNDSTGGRGRMNFVPPPQTGPHKQTDETSSQ